MFPASQAGSCTLTLAIVFDQAMPDDLSELRGVGEATLGFRLW